MATTELHEHGASSLESIVDHHFDSEEIVEEISEKKDEFFDYINSWEQTPVSDYGISKLLKILEALYSESNVRMQISLMSQLLDVIHMRNDLSAFLVKGGQESLSELSELNV